MPSSASGNIDFNRSKPESALSCLPLIEVLQRRGVERRTDTFSPALFREDMAHPTLEYSAVPHRSSSSTSTCSSSTCSYVAGPVFEVGSHGLYSFTFAFTFYLHDGIRFVRGQIIIHQVDLSRGENLVLVLGVELDPLTPLVAPRGETNWG